MVSRVRPMYAKALGVHVAKHEVTAGHSRPSILLTASIAHSGDSGEE